MKRLGMLPWMTAFVLAIGMAKLAVADECVIEGDQVKLSGRVWAENTEHGEQWVAQLDKPVCVWGVNPKTKASYKVSDTVMLVRLEAGDAKVQKKLSGISYSRAVLQGHVVVERDGSSRLKCGLLLSSVEEAEAGKVWREVISREGGKEPWVMRASSALKDMLSRPHAVETIGRDVLGLIHPLSNFDGVNSWSVDDSGKILQLRMRLMWKGKLTKKLYASEILWKSSEQGHIAAELVNDESTLPVTAGKIEKMDAYFRTQVWPSLYNRLR